VCLSFEALPDRRELPWMQLRDLIMKTILIVDDSTTIRRILQEALSSEDYIVLEAKDGHDALTKLETTIPDAVVSDIHMPDLNGLELVSRIREDERLKALPVLVLTTEREKEFKQRAREAGATAWLAKPFDDDVLLTALRRLIG